MLRNVKLIIEYDGTDYCGFQDQGRADRPTVQATLERAIAQICGEPIKVIGAGRTDAGVHALGQVVNFRTRARIPVERLPVAINTKLPWDIKVRAAEQVPDAFHARFWARRKVYRYMWFTRATPSPFWHRYALFVPQALRVEDMDQAAALFVGEHDFAAFRSAHGSAKSTVRRMFSSKVRQEGDRVCFEIEGTGFVYNMVRIMAGTLLEIGLGRRDAGTVAQALRSGRREDLGSTAPPHGLTLVSVAYDGSPDSQNTCEESEPIG